jgi:hypothetical protein
MNSIPKRFFLPRIQFTFIDINKRSKNKNKPNATVLTNTFECAM